MSDGHDQNFERIGKHFEYAVRGRAARGGTEGAETGLVDDITAADLLLHKVFAEIDRTHTNAGQAILYSMLRTQCTGAASLEERTRRIAFFRDHEKFRARIAGALSRIGFQTYEDLVPELWDFRRMETLKFLLPLKLWIGLTFLSFITPVFLGFQGFVFIIFPVLIVNLLIHAAAKRKIGVHMDALRYLFRILGGTARILKAFSGERAGTASLPENGELERCHRSLRTIRKNGRFLIPLSVSGSDPISLMLEFGKVFFLLETHAFLSTYHLLEKKLPDTRKLYELLGSLDVYCSLADYLERTDLPVTAAVVREEGTEQGIIGFEHLVHPLVENCVGNTLNLAQGIVLTGTNMSGKSTFLRTLGINQLTALTFGFAWAQGFRTGFHPVISSISSQDDLLTHTSRYFAEAKRLLTVINTVTEGKRRFFVLVDEILSGTNSEDRIRASIRILEKLARSGALVVSATHDLEIARTLSGLYENFHFSEKIGDGTLEFDYTIKPGIVDQRNALGILSYLGYPEDIIRDLSGIS